MAPVNGVGGGQRLHPRRMRSLNLIRWSVQSTSILPCALFSPRLPLGGTGSTLSPFPLLLTFIRRFRRFTQMENLENLRNLCHRRIDLSDSSTRRIEITRAPFPRRKRQRTAALQDAARSSKRGAEHQLLDCASPLALSATTSGRVRKCPRVPEVMAVGCDAGRCRS